MGASQQKSTPEGIIQEQARNGESLEKKGVRAIDVKGVWGFFRVHANDNFEMLTPGDRLSDKTLLYVHGWQPDHSKTAFDPLAEEPDIWANDNETVGNRWKFPQVSEGFVTPQKTYGTTHDCAQAWREAGYEVVAFCWAPLADELTPTEPERKIWDEQDGKQHLRWKCPGCMGCEGSGACVGKTGKVRKLDEKLGPCDKGYRSDFMPSGSLGQAFSNAWEELVASGGSRPNYLHLVGHSLGSQLACSFLRQQLKLAANGQTDRSRQVVQRLTLLDPYFSNFSKAYLGGRWTGEVVREVVKEVASSGTPVEQYKSSLVLNNPGSDSNDELLHTTAYFVMQPKFISVKFGVKDIEVLSQRHSAAKYIYFCSKGCAPPAEVKFKHPVGPWEPVDGSEGGGYASASDSRIRALMGPDTHWYQIGGTDSPDPALHTYEQRKGPSNSSLPVLPAATSKGGSAALAGYS